MSFLNPSLLLVALPLIALPIVIHLINQRRYQKALGVYLDGLRQVVLESAVDYHRVSIDEDYEQVLMRFLIGRARGKGGR